MGLLCKGVIQSFQLTNKMQHCGMQSSCSAGRCIWTLNPQEEWFNPLKRCYVREGSGRSHMHFQAGETSPACGEALPSPDRPLALYLCHPLLSDSPSLGIAQPALTCPLSS